MASRRNPKWQRDEILLALDLYFRLNPGQIHARNPEVIELSHLLNKLPIVSERPDAERFRNPNGVGLKLSNFLAIDPLYKGQGMISYSKLDEQVFFEFVDNKIFLRDIANRIRQITENPAISSAISDNNFPDEMGLFEASEGRILFRLHRYRERASNLVKKKKDLELQRSGTLQCEVCNFDFFKTYGNIGFGFIECHHRVPLSNLEINTKTKLTDLALVCSNCHRMLHSKEYVTLDSLRNRIRRN